MNKVILLGRLVKDPVIKTNEKAKVGYIKLAVNRGFKNAEGEYEADFIDVVTFSHVAEYLNLYATKGDLLSLEGRLQSSSYENDGATIYKTDVVAEKISLVAKSKKESEENVKPE